MTSTHNIKKTNWRKFGHYRESFLFDYMFFSEDWNFKVIGVDYIIKNFLMIEFDFYVDEEQDTILKSRLRKKIFSEDISFYKQYIRDYKSAIRSYMNISNQIHKYLNNHNSTALSNQELLKLFTRWINENKKLNPWLYSLNAIDFYIFDEDIKKRLNKFIPEEDTNKVLHIIAYSSKPFFMNQEIEQLLKIACLIQEKQIFKSILSDNIKELKEKDPHIYNLLFLHYNKFRWLNSYLWLNYTEEFSHYIARLKTLLEEDCSNKLRKIMLKKREKLKKIKDIIKKVNNSEFKELVSLIRELVYLKTYRIDIYSISGYKILRLFDELCSRLKLSYNDLVYLSHIEIIEALQGKLIDKDIIEERKKGYAIVRDEQAIEIYTGRDLKKIREIFNNNEYNVKEVKGNVAFRGIVRGRAKVIKNASELHKIEQDDIIIAPMTDINYIPILHLVKGIITDEGGILCHSAVVSREFEIPCIIGTEMATKIFNDGDLIELDAENGIVKKLK